VTSTTPLCPTIQPPPPPTLLPDTTLFRSLLLQVSAELNQIGGVVLYVTGEESSSQIKMRAQRLTISETDFYIYSETDLSLIVETIEKLKPDYIVIDSIQTMYHPRIDSVAGSVSQVREWTAFLMQLA